MHDHQSPRLAAGGAWQDNEEQAWRLWAASAHRALAAMQNKRFTAAEIYWRSAFELALQHLAAGRERFTPVHLLEPLQGLAGLLIAQGRWMAARSLFNEVSEFFHQRNMPLPDLAERLLQATAQRIAQAQKANAPPTVDNVEELPRAAAMKGLTPQVRSAGLT